MGAITDIFRNFGPEYLARYPDMPIQHKKTVDAIINCRSGHYGVTVYQCGNCGKQHHIDRSCGNRHCPRGRDRLERLVGLYLLGKYFTLLIFLKSES